MILKWKHLLVALVILSFMASVSAVDDSNQLADNDIKVSQQEQTNIITQTDDNQVNNIEKQDNKKAKTANKTIKTTTTIDNVEARISDNITLNATVLAEDNSPINTGYVIFKVNSQTLKDNNNNAIKVNVVDSIAQLKYTVPKSWNKNNLSITAVYSGSSQYSSSRSNASTINVTKRNANMQLFTEKYKVIGGTNVTFTAIVLDDYTLLNEGIVIFKVNGETIKDKNGKNIQAKVVNGKASIDYTFAYGISAKNTTITAVYSNSIYERAEANITVYINKTRPIIKVVPIITTTNQTRITASIVEFNGQPIKFTTVVAIKINKQTFAKVNAVNGIIDVTINTKFKSGTYVLSIVAGENNRYLAQSIDTIIEKK